MDEENIIEEVEETQQTPTRREIKKAKNQHNVDNNEKAIRVAAAALKDKGIPYASAIAAGVDTADKVTGGKSTRALGHVLNKANKQPFTGGRRLQKAINKAGDNGTLDAANNVVNATNAAKNTGKNASNNGNSNNTNSQLQKGSNSKESDIKGEIKIKIPLAVKIAILYALPFIFIGFVILVIMGAELEINGSAVGSYTHGTTCITVTVENTGCDENGDNCTLEHDGNVQLEDYIAGVVAAEAGDVGNLEYYKLLAITTRTYVFENIDNTCKVEGNQNFKKYINVKDSPNASLIKQAVDETEKLVILEQDNLIYADYSDACVVKEDSENYYIRYGSRHFDDVKMQAIPKQWDQNNSKYPYALSNLYSQTNINDTNYNDKDCPTNNDDSGLSKIGAYYLITEQNYSYQEVLEYYYGSGVEVETNKLYLSGAEGFINPTDRIYCTSPFGTRTHPVKGNISHHTGLDIAIGSNKPIYAANDGTVRAVVNTVTAINNCNYGYGNYIIIDHGDGISTLYGHIKYDTIPTTITVGSYVSQGEQIGAIGSTGCSTGPHLHYEVRENNVQVDPTDYMDLTDASGVCTR